MHPLALGTIFGTVAALGIVFGGHSLNHSVLVTPEPEAMDMAKHGKATVENTCKETVKFQQRLAEQYKKVSDGKQSAFVLDVPTCVKALNEKEAAARAARIGAATRAVAGP